MELHAISTKISHSGGRFEITMPAHSRQSLLRETSVDSSKYFSLLSNVSAEYSVCSRDADRVSIHSAIRDSIGFDGLNRSIYSVICNWIIGQLQLLTHEMKDSNPLGSIQRMKALGTILHEMGRYSEALQVFLDASQMFLSYGKAAPLSFGTDIDSLDSQIDMKIIRVYVHLGKFDMAQKRYDEAMMRNKNSTSIRVLSIFDLNFSASEDEAAGGSSDNLDLVDQWEHLRFYHRLLFSDSDDPEFLQSCNTHMVAGTDGTDLSKLQNAMNNPLLYLQLKQTAFQLKINRLPAAHPWVALAMLQLAHAHFQVDNFEAALSLLNRTLPFLRRLPSLHPSIILALLLRSACLMKHGSLDQATSVAEEALTMSTRRELSRIPVPVEFEQAAQEAHDLCCDPDFRSTVISSEHADAREFCVSRFVAVIKTIGTDEARMEKVIINRGRDAAHAVLEKILPRVQSNLDAELAAEGKPSIDVCVLLVLASTGALHLTVFLQAQFFQP